MTLHRYEVIETMAYEVTAESEDAAVALIRDAANRDNLGPACLDRYAVEDADADADTGDEPTVIPQTKRERAAALLTDAQIDGILNAAGEGSEA